MFLQSLPSSTNMSVQSGLLLKQSLSPRVCSCSELLVGTQLSVTASAGLGKSFYSFNSLVAFSVTASMRLSFLFLIFTHFCKEETSAKESSILIELSVGNPLVVH